MKANELRIGNIINHITGEITVKSDDFEHIEKDPCEYMGIELTEDWLIRFGFINSPYGHTINDTMMKLFKFNKAFYMRWVVDPSGERTNWQYITSFQYVHQLQNLYFALTGEELKIINK